MEMKVKHFRIEDKGMVDYTLEVQLYANTEWDIEYRAAWKLLLKVPDDKKFDTVVDLIHHHVKIGNFSGISLSYSAPKG